MKVETDCTFLCLEDICRNEKRQDDTPTPTPTPEDNTSHGDETDGHSAMDTTHEETDITNSLIDEKTTPEGIVISNLEEWDSDSSFEFDHDDWPVKTPKFVHTEYQKEIFPFEILEEGN